ncbi:MAG: LysM peptidoglycan-binding domain-containing protein [Clostridia bacterium]|nr:LysM peptidoglycan-binding domain-containing protein [Clostridia bacterium]
MIIYTVKPGDTLFNIARRYSVESSRLSEVNGLRFPDRLAVGQELVIPLANAYEVQSGDSLYSIALDAGVSLDALKAANPQIASPYTIYAGEVIFLPERPRPSIRVNGYVYPSVNTGVLERTLPYLTFLSIFSYRTDAGGNLNTIEDEPLIQTARAAGVAPVMVVTNTRSGGGFDSDLIATLLTNPSASQRLIDNILATLRAKNYYGVDIDFEYIPPANREDYNRFLENLSAALQPEGYKLSTALAPKIRADQPGTLYEAHDYAFHGQIVDQVILMTYEWGYLYGPPMAVAPIEPVKQVLDFAVSVIPPEKILMGMPNYGYDWTLPYVSGRPAEVLTIQQAVERAIQNGARIEYSTGSQAPFFRYTKNGEQHIVWFENASSTKARLSLVSQYGLGGVSYWTLNSFFPQNWAVLESMYRVEKVI